ncbi:ATP-binding protein [Arthrobacter sp. LAPM80]|uniref:ATP-binding protein n=1 Tax=Arthrobacter sp. LAPM80 TaxID=3141788 RepID=UPI00398B6713
MTDFEALFHQAPAGYIITSTDGTILEVNDTFLVWSGLQRTSVLGMNLLRLFPVADRIMYATHALPHLASTGEFNELAADIIGNGGQHHPALLSATRSPSAPGKAAVDKIIVFSAPRRRSYEKELESSLRIAQEAVNARIRAEAETAAHRETLIQKDKDLHASLKQSRRNESLLQAILDSVDVGIAVVDAEGNPTTSNSRYQYDLNYATPEGSGSGQVTEMLVYGPDGTTALSAQEIPMVRAAQGESFSDEIIWIGPPDSLRALSVSALNFKDDDDSTCTVISCGDVTSLINAMAAQKHFVSNVSHELRTPLTSIIGYLYLALDEPDLPVNISASLTVAMRNSERLMQLVNDLLSTAEAGITIEPRPTDLAELIRARVTAARLRAEANNVLIATDIPPVLPTVVDPLRIGQILDNLISNAIKYSPGGDITITARHTPKSIVVEVTDTGIGMTPEELENAFTKFFRSASVLKAAIPGAGLGLAITNNLIQAHRGTISLTSEPGHGTTATVTLPHHF